MLGWRVLDYVVVGAYLTLTAGLGAYFSQTNQTTEDYFLGSRGLPGWAVGFSLLSTTMSSVTFLAYPATSYLLDWRLFTKDFFYPLVSVFTALLVAPRFREQLKSASVYEFLETRFGLACRLFGAATYVVSQLLKLCTTLYLMSVPISMLVGLPLPLVIVFTGVFVTAYSMSGGISAVVYTDVLQAIILLMGGLVSVAAVAWRVPGHFMGVVREGHQQNKFSLGEAEWSWEQRTIPTVLAYSLVHYLTKFVTFQDAVQRYLAVPSHKELLKAISLTGSLALPTWALFYFIGTCLWAFYRAFPSPALQGLSPDAIFPNFIMHHLPPGIAGVVISGVLAAAMSTMDSALNATASVVVIDFLQRCVLPGRPDLFYLRCARCVSALAACFMIGTALILEFLPMESLNEWYNAMQSILAGAVVTLFLFALYVPWFTNKAMLAAILGSFLVNLFLMAGTLEVLPDNDFCEFFNDLNAYWVAPFVNVAFVVIAVLAQLYLSSPWGAAMSNQPFSKTSTLKAKTFTLSALEEQQLLPEHTSSSKHMLERAVHSSSGVGNTHAEGKQLTPRQTEDPRAAQIELSRLSPTSKFGMPRRRSQPHLPVHELADAKPEQSHNA